MRYIANVTTLRYAPEKCTGCARCVDVCPHGVFVIESKRARITDLDACMECGACSRNCAFGALAVDSGVGCASALINSMVSGGNPTCDCSGDADTCC